MERNNILPKLLLLAAFISVAVFADVSVDKSNGILSINSDKSGTVRAKVINPNNEIIIDETYEGNSFSWTPAGTDGAYRYDVSIKGERAAGSIEVTNGKIATFQDEEK